MLHEAPHVARKPLIKVLEAGDRVQHARLPPLGLGQVDDGRRVEAHRQLERLAVEAPPELLVGAIVPEGCARVVHTSEVELRALKLASVGPEHEEAARHGAPLAELDHELGGGVPHEAGRLGVDCELVDVVLQRLCARMHGYGVGGKMETDEYSYHDICMHSVMSTQRQSRMRTMSLSITMTLSNIVNESALIRLNENLW